MELLYLALAIIKCFSNTFLGLYFVTGYDE
jgi:hypothetical protein